MIFLRFWLNIFSKSNFYCCAFSFLGGNLHSISRSIIQRNTFCDRRKPKSCPLSCADRLLYFMQPFRSHSLSVITDRKNQGIPFFSSFYQNLTFASSILDPMINGNFCQRLNVKLGNGNSPEFLRYMDLKLQNIPVAVLLYLQITQCMTLFL